MNIKRCFMGTLEIVCMPESEVVLHGCILQWHLELYTIIWHTYISDNWKAAKKEDYCIRDNIFLNVYNFFTNCNWFLSLKIFN